MTIPSGEASETEPVSVFGPSNAPMAQPSLMADKVVKPKSLSELKPLPRLLAW